VSRPRSRRCDRLNQLSARPPSRAAEARALFLSEGQPPHAAPTQSSCQRCSQDQRKYLRDPVSSLGPAPGTQSSDRSPRPSTVSTDLADPAPGSPLRRTRPSRHQTVKAKAHYENDPATPESGLSDRSTESSTQPSTSAVIFEPGSRGAQALQRGILFVSHQASRTGAPTELVRFLCWYKTNGNRSFSILLLEGCGHRY
jgi:hypothetical protein